MMPQWRGRDIETAVIALDLDNVPFDEILKLSKTLNSFLLNEDSPSKKDTKARKKILQALLKERRGKCGQEYLLLAKSCAPAICLSLEKLFFAKKKTRTVTDFSFLVLLKKSFSTGNLRPTFCPDNFVISCLEIALSPDSSELRYMSLSLGIHFPIQALMNAVSEWIRKYPKLPRNGDVKDVLVMQPTLLLVASVQLCLSTNKDSKKPFQTAAKIVADICEACCAATFYPKRHLEFLTKFSEDLCDLTDCLWPGAELLLKTLTRHFGELITSKGPNKYKIAALKNMTAIALKLKPKESYEHTIQNIKKLFPEQPLEGMMGILLLASEGVDNYLCGRVKEAIINLWSHQFENSNPPCQLKDLPLSPKKDWSKDEAAAAAHYVECCKRDCRKFSLYVQYILRASQSPTKILKSTAINCLSQIMAADPKKLGLQVDKWTELKPCETKNVKVVKKTVRFKDVNNKNGRKSKQLSKATNRTVQLNETNSYFSESGEETENLPNYPDEVPTLKTGNKRIPFQDRMKNNKLAYSKLKFYEPNSSKSDPYAFTNEDCSQVVPRPSNGPRSQRRKMTKNIKTKLVQFLKEMNPKHRNIAENSSKKQTSAPTRTENTISKRNPNSNDSGVENVLPSAITNNAIITSSVLSAFSETQEVVRVGKASLVPYSSSSQSSPENSTIPTKPSTFISPIDHSIENITVLHREKIPTLFLPSVPGRHTDIIASSNIKQEPRDDSSEQNFCSHINKNKQKLAIEQQRQNESDLSDCLPPDCTIEKRQGANNDQNQSSLQSPSEGVARLPLILPVEDCSIENLSSEKRLISPTIFLPHSIVPPRSIKQGPKDDLSEMTSQNANIKQNLPIDQQQLHEDYENESDSSHSSHPDYTAEKLHNSNNDRNSQNKSSPESRPDDGARSSGFPSIPKDSSSDDLSGEKRSTPIMISSQTHNIVPSRAIKQEPKDDLSENNSKNESSDSSHPDRNAEKRLGSNNHSNSQNQSSPNNSHPQIKKKKSQPSKLQQNEDSENASDSSDGSQVQGPNNNRSRLILNNSVFKPHRSSSSKSSSPENFSSDSPPPDLTAEKLQESSNENSLILNNSVFKSHRSSSSKSSSPEDLSSDSPLPDITAEKLQESNNEKSLILKKSINAMIHSVLNSQSCSSSESSPEDFSSDSSPPDHTVEKPQSSYKNGNSQQQSSPDVVTGSPLILPVKDNSCDGLSKEKSLCPPIISNTTHNMPSICIIKQEPEDDFCEQSPYPQIIIKEQDLRLEHISHATSENESDSFGSSYSDTLPKNAQVKMEQEEENSPCIQQHASSNDSYSSETPLPQDTTENTQNTRLGQNTVTFKESEETGRNLLALQGVRIQSRVIGKIKLESPDKTINGSGVILPEISIKTEPTDEQNVGQADFTFKKPFAKRPPKRKITANQTNVDVYDFDEDSQCTQSLNRGKVLTGIRNNTKRSCFQNQKEIKREPGVPQGSEKLFKYPRLEISLVPI